MTTEDHGIVRGRGAGERPSPLHAASLRDTLHKALADLERAEGELVATRIQLDITRDQMRTMRLSRAWRSTAPVRRLMRRVTRGESW